MTDKKFESFKNEEQENEINSHPSYNYNEENQNIYSSMGYQNPASSSPQNMPNSAPSQNQSHDSHYHTPFDNPYETPTQAPHHGPTIVIDNNYNAPKSDANTYKRYESSAGLDTNDGYPNASYDNRANYNQQTYSAPNPSPQSYNNPSPQPQTPYESNNAPQQPVKPNTRIHIDDYKFQSMNTPEYTNMPQQAARKGNSKIPLELSDEKIVWIGSIFVFFGILLFLLGYWMGKTVTIRTQEKNIPLLSDVEKELSNEKNSNALISEINTDLDNGQLTTPKKVDTKNLPEISKPAPAPKTPSVKTTTKATTKAPAPVSKPSTSTKSTSSAKTNASSSAAQTGKQYTIQVSAHTKLDQARIVESSLRKQGYDPYIAETIINGTKYYRVRVGKYNSHTDAQTTLNRLKNTAQGKEGYIIQIN